MKFFSKIFDDGLRTTIIPRPTNNKNIYQFRIYIFGTNTS